MLIAHNVEAHPVRSELRRIFREAERASRIVRNLLVFTGSRRMKRRRLRVDRILARALASRRTALERAGIEVVRRFPEPVPWVTGDPLLLQQAFVNKSALQCGICIPGHVMAACALLEKNPDPGDEEIRASADSVYCRCTGYVRILEAYREAIALARKTGKP